MHEKRGRHRRMSRASALGFAAALSFAPASAQTGGWRTWTAGDLSFGAPAAMRAPALDQPFPAPVDSNRPDWTFTLTDAPDRPDLGATITFTWSRDTDENASDDDVLSRGRTSLASLPATITRWRSAGMGWRGLDVTTRGLSPKGEVFRASCHAPERRWATVESVCMKIVASVSITSASPSPDPAPDIQAGDAAAPKATSPAPQTVWTRPPAHEVLFSGALDARWDKLAAFGGDFDAFAKVTDAGLAVQAPAGHGWGRTGIVSSVDGALFLDDFGEGAKHRLTFRFDPSLSRSFTILLVRDRADCLGGDRGGVAFDWRPKPDGAGAIATLVASADSFGAAERGKQRVSGETAAPGPSEVTIDLTPGAVSAAADGIAPLEAPLGSLGRSAPRAICVFAQAPAENQPSAMGLRAIAIDRAPGAPEPPRTPMARVVQFGRGASMEWEPAAFSGGDFAKFARLGEDRLDVSVPEKHGWGWGSTGLLSKSPIGPFDAFADEAPYRLAFKFDPARTTGFSIALMPERDWGWARFAGARGVVTGVSPEPGGPQLFLSQCRGDVRRAFPTGWDGRFEIVLAKDGYRAGAPDGPAITCRAPDYGAFGAKMFIGVLAQAARENGPAELSLLEIVGERLAPADASAVRKWSYVADQDFDAKAFVRDVAKEFQSAQPTGLGPDLR
jgi:hypothetical protein